MTRKRKIKTNIKNVIRSNNTHNKKLIKNLQKNLKELQDCTISISGLEKLSKQSIKRIQQKRHLQLQKLKKSSMQIVAYEKKITVIEKKAITKTKSVK